MQVPVAHAEGRFLISDDLLTELKNKGQVVFQYCNDKGEIDSDFPVNPNGSVDNIAAIANQAGNVMAIMPHPERTPAGDGIFASMRRYIQDRRLGLDPTMHGVGSRPNLPVPQLFWHGKNNAYQCLVSLIITDNQAMSVQNALRQLGFPVIVKRFVHWEISTASLKALNALKESELLFCPRREREVSTAELAEGIKDKDKDKNTIFYLIRPKEDMIGQKTLQTFSLHWQQTENEMQQAIQAIQHGVLWQFESLNGNIHECIDAILQTNIIGNPYAHDCYEYQLFG
jgi:phosphoribosylformylglycinamidine synthase